MPVAFLFNRRLEGADDQCLADALSGFNYAMGPPGEGDIGGGKNKSMD